MTGFLSRFHELMTELLKKKNVEENLSKITRFLEAEIKFQSLGIFLKTSGSTNYRLKISRKISHSYAKNTVFSDRDDLVLDLKNLQPMEFEDDKYFSFEKPYSHLLVFPLHNNRIFLGFLFVDLNEGKFSPEDITKIGLISIILSIIVELEQMRDQLEHTKNLDEVTGFLNYGAFYERCEELFIQMKRYNRPLSLVIVKIDDFEKIVRTIGKEETDALIRAITKLIKENIRKTDVLGKLYNDLYGILMPETDVNKALVAVKRMDEMITRIPKMENRNIGWGLLVQSDRVADVDDFISKTREAALESCRKSVYKFTVYQD